MTGFILNRGSLDNAKQMAFGAYTDEHAAQIRAQAPKIKREAEGLTNTVENPSDFQSILLSAFGKLVQLEDIIGTLGDLHKEEVLDSLLDADYLTDGEKRIGDARKIDQLNDTIDALNEELARLQDGKVELQRALPDRERANIERVQGDLDAIEDLQSQVKALKQEVKAWFDQAQKFFTTKDVSSVDRENPFVPNIVVILDAYERLQVLREADAASPDQLKLYNEVSSGNSALLSEAKALIEDNTFQAKADLPSDDRGLASKVAVIKAAVAKKVGFDWGSGRNAGDIKVGKEKISLATLVRVFPNVANDSSYSAQVQLLNGAISAEEAGRKDKTVISDIKKELATLKNAKKDFDALSKKVAENERKLAEIYGKVRAKLSSGVTASDSQIGKIAQMSSKDDVEVSAVVDGRRITAGELEQKLIQAESDYVALVDGVRSELRAVVRNKAQVKAYYADAKKTLEGRQQDVAQRLSRAVGYGRRSVVDIETLKARAEEHIASRGPLVEQYVKHDAKLREVKDELTQAESELRAPERQISSRKRVEVGGEIFAQNVIQVLSNGRFSSIREIDQEIRKLEQVASKTSNKQDKAQANGHITTLKILKANAETAPARLVATFEVLDDITLKVEGLIGIVLEEGIPEDTKGRVLGFVKECQRAIIDYRNYHGSGFSRLDTLLRKLEEVATAKTASAVFAAHLAAKDLTVQAGEQRDEAAGREAYRHAIERGVEENLKPRINAKIEGLESAKDYVRVALLKEMFADGSDLEALAQVDRYADTALGQAAQDRIAVLQANQEALEDELATMEGASEHMKKEIKEKLKLAKALAKDAKANEFRGKFVALDLSAVSGLNRNYSADPAVTRLEIEGDYNLGRFTQEELSEFFDTHPKVRAMYQRTLRQEKHEQETLVNRFIPDLQDGINLEPPETKNYARLQKVLAKNHFGSVEKFIEFYVLKTLQNKVKLSGQVKDIELGSEALIKKLAIHGIDLHKLDSQTLQYVLNFLTQVLVEKSFEYNIPALEAARAEGPIAVEHTIQQIATRLSYLITDSVGLYLRDAEDVGREYLANLIEPQVTQYLEEARELIPVGLRA